MRRAKISVWPINGVGVRISLCDYCAEQADYWLGWDLPVNARCFQCYYQLLFNYLIAHEEETDIFD